MAIISTTIPDPRNTLNPLSALDTLGDLKKSLDAAAQNAFSLDIQGTVSDWIGRRNSAETPANIPVSASAVLKPTLPAVAQEKVVETIEPGPVCVLKEGPSSEVKVNPYQTRPEELIKKIEDRVNGIKELPVVKAARELKEKASINIGAAFGLDAVDQAQQAAELAAKQQKELDKGARETALAVNQENPSLANSENRVNQLSKYYGTAMGMHNNSLKSIGDSLGGILNAIISIPSTIINAVLGAVRQVIDAVLTGIRELLAPVLEVLQTALGGMLKLVGDTIGKLVSGILGPIASVTSAVKSEIDAVTQAKKRTLAGPANPKPSNADPSYKSVTNEEQKKAIEENGKVVPAVKNIDNSIKNVDNSLPTEGTGNG